MTSRELNAELSRLRLQVEHLKHANREAVERAGQRELEAQALRERIRKLEGGK